jgi:hypothetical protein
MVGRLKMKKLMQVAIGVAVLFLATGEPVSRHDVP